MARELAFARTREPDATRRKAEVGKRHRRVAKRHRLPRYRRSGPRGRDTITENGLRMDGGGGGVSSVSRSAAVRRNHAPSLATIPLRKENSRSFFLTTEPRPPTIARARTTPRPAAYSIFARCVCFTEDEHGITEAIIARDFTLMTKLAPANTEIYRPASR